MQEYDRVVATYTNSVYIVPRVRRILSASRFGMAMTSFYFLCVKEQQ